MEAAGIYGLQPNLELVMVQFGIQDLQFCTLLIRSLRKQAMESCLEFLIMMRRRRMGFLWCWDNCLLVARCLWMEYFGF